MKPRFKKTDITVSGMHCASCANRLQKALSSKDGVISAEVNFGTGTASVDFDHSKITIQELKKTIENAGFKTPEKKISITIGGMHCAACAAKVKDALCSVEGVIDASVNPVTESALVTLATQMVNSAELNRAVSEAGFEYRGIIDEYGAEESEKLKAREQQGRLYRMITAFSVSLPMMIAMYLPSVMHHRYTPFIMLLISAPTFVYVSSTIFTAAWSALKNGSLTMDVMYAMGITTAFSASVLSTFGIIFSHQFMFYETAIMLAGFLTLGRFLEARARGKTSESIKKLIRLQPATATVIRNNEQIEIPVEALVKGDRIVVKPGEKIAVDGNVTDGESSVDESMITGESIPVVKKTGSPVIGGTFNRNGVLQFKAERVGKDTVLSQIIKLVREAQGSRPPVQKIADKAVEFFIPFVLAVALLSFIGWYFYAGASLLFAFTTFVAVLVIACPCALGLASPTAVTVGIGRGAELGILIKNGESLELAQKVTLLIFDKTGTLTAGHPVVTDMSAFEISENTLLFYAASVEKNSGHPLGDAILSAAKKAGITLGETSGFFTVEGKGVRAEVNGKMILIGNRLFLNESGIDFSRIDKKITEMEQQGKTVILVADSEKLLGSIAIADPLKKSSQKAVTELKKMGCDVVMITGDNKRTASSVASQAGITRVLAEVLPQDKAAEVKRLQAEGQIVAFVGDGINDAPALAQADVGIALGSGTDVAVESAQIVLVKNDPLDAVAAIQLGRKMMQRIKWNLFWAFAYNGALIPLAAGMLYPLWGISFRPELAGFAMAMSSVTVVTLSLLLKRYTPPALHSCSAATKKTAIHHSTETI